MTTSAAALRGYIARYRDAIASVRYPDLRRLQPPPFASVTYGAGGTAYALWRLGESRRAAAWLAAAIPDRADAAYDDALGRRSRASYLEGRAGLHVVHALAQPRAREQAVRAFLRCIRRGRGIDFMDGAAGWLTAMRLLRDRRPGGALDRVGDTLAAALARRVRARSRRDWEPTDAIAFAHGWTGVLHAILAWRRARDLPPQPWLVGSLRRLAMTWAPGVVRGRHLPASWCNGLAGATLLWSEAYAHSGEPVFLRSARAAGRAATRLPSPTSALCCGASGVGFALLELDRVDPGHGWRARAERIAAWAVARAATPTQWPNGLYRGHPGVVCLAVDLTSSSPGGFPLVMDRAPRA